MKRIYFVTPSLFVGSFLLIVLLSACGRSPGGTAATEVSSEEETGPKLIESAAKGINVVEVTPQPGRMEILLSGKIQYKEDRVSKVSSPVAGRASRILAKLGDRVSEGAPLAAIESPEAGSAYADFLRARSDLAFSERALHLAEDLYETRAISQKELQQAKNDYLKAKTELNRTKARLLSFYRDPDREEESGSPSAQALFELKAPISGVVVEKNITQGQGVSADPSQPLFTVADLSTVDFVGQIFEKDVARIALNAEVVVTVDAYPDERFLGRVRYIGAQVDPATRTIQVRGEVPNSAGRLKPEMFARIAIQSVSAEKILAVPQSAVVEEGGKNYLFLVKPDQAFEKRAVTLGPRWGAEIQVSDGLRSGDRVVTSGALLLKAAFSARS